MSLESFKPHGNDTSDNVFLQTLDAYGRTVNNYSWVNWAGDNGDEEAWIDDNFEIVTGVSFEPGQGVWIQSNSTESQSIQTAGQVSSNDIAIELQFGGTVTGNPFPIAIDLQDVLPTGNDTSDNVFLQTLDAYGRTVDNYSWVNWAGDNGDEEAWIDDNFEIVAGVSFEPGQGIWIQSNSSEEQSVVFPAPEL